MKDLLLKGEYLKEQLQKGLNEVFEAQRAVAARKIDRSDKARKSRSGSLMASLMHPDCKLTSGAAFVHGVVTYPSELRFQDIKSLGNWRIYNKQLWPVIYRKTLKNIRFEFSAWLRDRAVRDLTDALKQ